MPLIVQQSPGSLQSDYVSIGLSDIELIQNKIYFDTGYSLNFVNLLSGCVDIKTKNFSNFYLTRKTDIDTNLKPKQFNFSPTSLYTRIKSGESSLSIQLLSSGSIDQYDYYYNLIFTDTPQYSDYFRINFINEDTCYISYNDSYGLNYLTTTNNEAVLKKAIFFDNTSSDEHIFRYVINKNKIFILKDIGGITYQLAAQGNKLVYITYTTNFVSNFINNALTIDNEVGFTQQDSNNTSFFRYNPSNINIDNENSIFNLSNNYLLYKNIDTHTINTLNIIALKNQSNDLGGLARANNLALSSESGLVDMRDYTSISNDIDKLEDEGLELNYVFYNKSIVIKPGRNYFTTESSLFPFTQININDTTIANCGAFGSSSPLYSDKILLSQTNNIGEDAVYLCTWLSGSVHSQNRKWLDRYYYPDLISKENALKDKPIFADTYQKYVENIIKNNPVAQNTISTNLFFDKLSDMVLKPSTTYVYERINLDNLSFYTQDNFLTTQEDGYYNLINQNAGFTLSFNLINQNDNIFREFRSTFNEIEGGLIISYNYETAIISFNLYDAKKNDFKIFTSTVSLVKGSDNNFVIDVDNGKGTIKVFVNGLEAINGLFTPLYYTTLLYGDFEVNNESIYEATGYISDTFLSVKPLTEEQVMLLIAKANNSKDDLIISLPCGMRNKSDVIEQINSLKSNLNSKSNFINIYVNNTDIENVTLVNEVKSALLQNINDVLPFNVTVNNIEILS